MNKQRGGSFTVSGWLALFLLTALAAVAAHDIYLLRHRQIVINFRAQQVQTLSPTRVHGDDSYETHVFPPTGGEVCTFANNICWIRI